MSKRGLFAPASANNSVLNVYVLVIFQDAEDPREENSAFLWVCPSEPSSTALTTLVRNGREEAMPNPHLFVAVASL